MLTEQLASMIYSYIKSNNTVYYIYFFNLIVIEVLYGKILFRWEKKEKKTLGHYVLKKKNCVLCLVYK